MVAEKQGVGAPNGCPPPPLHAEWGRSGFMTQKTYIRRSQSAQAARLSADFVWGGGMLPGNREVGQGGCRMAGDMQRKPWGKYNGNGGKLGESLRWGVLYDPPPPVEVFWMALLEFWN